MSNVTLLVATGNVYLNAEIRKALQGRDYSIIFADNGNKCLELFKGEAPGMVILDANISDCDGLSAIREIIRVSDIPVICVSESCDSVDKVLFLEMGADDFITSPFESRELSARVRAVLRRYLKGKNSVSKELVFRSLSINLSNYTLKVNGKTMAIPPKELELLYFLASNPNTVFNRDQLLDRIWGYDYFGDSRTVDVHIKRLRSKLEDAEDGWSIKTVWGVGYEFSTE